MKKFVCMVLCILTLCFTILSTTSCAGKYDLPDDADPLLVQWYSLVMTREVEASAFTIATAYERMPHSSQLPTTMYLNENTKDAFSEILDYFQTLELDFVGVREMTDPIGGSGAACYLTGHYDVIGLWSFEKDSSVVKAGVEFTVKEDGSLLIQDASRGVELYTEAGEVDYEEFWKFVNYYYNKYKYTK